MTVSASDVLTVARRDLGVEENPHGSNRVKFSEWYGMVGPWCAMATSYWLQRAGMPRGPLTHFAYTPYGEAAYRRAGRWGSTPRIGALVFFNFIGRTSHVGIVEAIHADGSITTIEGNTDSAGGRTGGRVMRHRRSSLIVGYGYPEYTASTSAGDAGGGADPMSYFCEAGQKGPVVNLAQRRINRALAPADRIEVDGEYGPATAQAAGKATGQGSRSVQRIGAAQIDRIETAILRRELAASRPAPAPAPPATLVPHRHQISSSQTGPAVKL